MNRVTIRDVAARAGVSIATVHLALKGKPGPKEETRKQVLALAKEMDYHCNSVASSLKRGVTRIAVILPALTGNNQLYYTPIWQGVRTYFEDVKDFNIELVEIPYLNGDVVSLPMEAVEQLQMEEKVAGLVALGDIEPAAKQALRTLRDGGLPIVLVNSDAPEVGRICCVQAENYLIGCTMGEMLDRQTPSDGSVLICAGDPGTPANADTTKGVEDYLAACGSNRTVYKIHFINDMKRANEQIVNDLRTYGDIAGCCSVTARGSVQLAEALIKTGLAGTMPAIGSDIFLQNIENLKRGVLSNLMFKNPFRQGWHAAEKLFAHVIQNQHTEDDRFMVKGEVVFKSSLAMYTDYKYQ